MFKLSFIVACLAFATPHAFGATCIVLAPGVAFGNYSAASANANESTGSILITCTAILSGFVSFTVELGTGIANGYTPRKLASGSQRLNYNLYLDSGYASIWGNGTGGTGTQSYSANLPIGVTIVPYTVYGRIPKGQSVAAGLYNDSVQVAVNY